MEEILINREAKICLNCNFRAKTAETRCPRCRKELKTEYEIQRKAIVMFLGGVVLAVVFGAIYLIAYKSSSAGLSQDEMRQRKIIVLLDFGLLMFMGLPLLIGGLWQYISGKDGETVAKPVAFLSALGVGLAAIYLFFF